MIWLLGGLGLLLAELVAPGVFLMWLGLAALGTGAATLAMGLPLGAEVALAGVLCVVSIALGWRLQRRGRVTLNTPESGLVGRRAVVLTFDGDRGRVRVGDTDWPARLAPLSAASDVLEVLAVDGTVLVVGRSGGGAGPGVRLPQQAN